MSAALNKSPLQSQTIDQALRSAAACHAAHHDKEAEDMYIAILQVEPKNPDANHNLGVLKVKTQRFDDSLQNFMFALEGDPTSSHYWLSYIEALLLSGRADDARVAMDHARAQGLQGAHAEALARKLVTKDRGHN